MLFCQQTHKTHSYYHLVTAEPLFIRIKISSIQQKQNIKREYRMLPSIKTNSSFSKSVMMFVAAQKWELFFVEPNVKSQWTILVKYLTISISVNCYQTHCRQQYYLPFSNSCCANSQLHFSWAMVPTGQSWTQLITRFWESIAAWIWVASQQNWRNETVTDWTLVEKQCYNI